MVKCTRERDEKKKNPQRSCESHSVRWIVLSRHRSLLSCGGGGQRKKKASGFTEITSVKVTKEN